MTSQEGSPPLYSFVFNGKAFIFPVVLFGIGAAGAFFPTIPETEFSRLAGGALLTSLTLFFLFGFLQLFLAPVRSASFHDDYFTVSKGKNQRTFAYAEIEAVSIKKAPVSKWFPYPSLRKQLQIHVKGTTEPVTIPMNVRSRKMPTDLYSWLTNKVHYGTDQTTSKTLA